MNCVVQFALFLVFPLAQTCVPAPESTLLVNASAFWGECGSFQSLTEALQVGIPLPYSHILVLPSPVETTVDEAVVISNEIKISGSESAVALQATLKVVETGKLTLAGLKIRSDGNYEMPIIDCEGGRVLIERSAILATGSNFVHLSIGNLTIAGSTVEDAWRWINVLSSKVQIVIEDTIFVNCSNVITLDERTNTATGLIVLNRLTVYDSGVFLSANIRHEGAFDVVMSDSVVSNSYQQLISGSITNLSFQLLASSLFSTFQLVSGALISSNITLRSCQIDALRSPLFDISALKGAVELVNVTVSGCQQGPLIFLRANPSPFHSALVSISSSRLSYLTNRAGSGSVFCCLGATLVISNTEVSNSSALDNGLFYIEQGAVELSFLVMKDCSGVTYGLFRPVLSEVRMVHSTVQRLENHFGGVCCCRQYSTCTWENSTFTVYDPDEPYWYLFVVSVFNSNATVRNCSFTSGVGATTLMAGASTNSQVIMENTVINGVNARETFGAYYDSFIELKNLSLINTKVEYLITCMFTEDCVRMSDIRFSGEVEIKEMMQSNGGHALLKNIDFRGISDTVVRASKANISFVNVTFRALRGVLCRNCISSTFTLIGFHLDGAIVQNALQMYYSELVISNFWILNLKCTQFLMMQNSQITLRDGKMEDFDVDSYGGILSAVSSSVVITSASFQRIASTESLYSGFLYLEECSLQVSNSYFSDFDSTFIHAVHASRITILGSTFMNGGQSRTGAARSLYMHGAALVGEFCAEVEISQSHFANSTAIEGGALYLLGSGVQKCKISHSRAEFNSARKVGGFLLAESVNLEVVGSDFIQNSAMQGGVISALGKAIVAIIDSRFYGNSATLSGGALQFYESIEIFNSCEWNNNTALYGPDIASGVSFLSVLNKTTLAPTSNYGIIIAAGQPFTEEIWIGCLDDLDQIVTTDNETRLELITDRANSSVAASKLLESARGIFHIPSLTVFGTPNTTLTVSGVYKSTLVIPLFAVNLRECERGEYFSELQCKVCSHNTYSFDPSEECRLCPIGADCPGGWQLELHKDYWRTTNSTAEIYGCFIPGVCNGGLNSECAPGHEGVLCEQCSSGHYKVNQLQCLSCGSQGVSVARGVIALCLSFTSAVYALTKSRETLLLHAALIDYLHSLRITLNFSLHWPTPIAYFYSILGDLSSFGLTAFTDSCNSPLSGVSSIESQAIVLGLFLAILVGIVVLCNLLFRRYILSLMRILLYFAYHLLPIVSLRALQQLPCFPVNGMQYLIYDPTVECWTRSHIILIVATVVPLLFAWILAAGILVVKILSKAGTRFRGKKRKSFFFLITLLRKLLLTALLVFPNALTLCTQVGVAILLNFAVEALLHFRQESVFFSLHHSVLVTNTLLFFVLAIYSAASPHGEYEAIFIALNVLLLALPALYFTGLLIRKVTRVSAVSASEVRLELSGVNGSVFETYVQDSVAIFVPQNSVTGVQT